MNARWMSSLCLLLMLGIVAAAGPVSGEDNATILPVTPTPEATILPITPTPEATILPITPTPEATHLPEMPGSGTSYYDIYTNVNGASVFFDAEYKGVTSGGLLTVPVATTGTPYSAVRAEKSGYQSASTSLPPVPGEDQHTSVYLTLNPVQPTTGDIDVTSSPSGANVYVDSVYYGTSPQLCSGISPGGHTLEVMKAGYDTWKQTVSVVAGQTTHIHASLSTSQQYGSLYVSSNPQGANVYLNGKYYGLTPRTIGSLLPESYTLELTKSGYYDWTKTVRIYANQETTVSKSLEKIAVPTTGTLSVTSNPSYATISVDGVSYGVTDPAYPLIINGIAAGRHTVRAELEGYNDETTSVSVIAGASTPVSFSLAPVTPDTGTASIQVASDPAGAQVYIDNLFKGTTPVTVEDLVPGEHTLKLTLAGYEDFTTSGTLSPGETASVTIQLTAAPPVEETPAGTIGILGGVCALACLATRSRSKKR
jgi:hypothetical protein